MTTQNSATGDEVLRKRAGGIEVIEFMESNGFKIGTSAENQYGYWYNENDQMTEGLGQAKYMFNLIKSRDQQIALAAENAFVDKLIEKVRDGSIEMIGINVEHLIGLKQAQNKEK